ncbi:MAG TPA: hypothetical protein DEP35_09540 [Deltaproteobacteria bacterium]|nr:hypothetical protein [Deltaproteobacteria bacterium]
MVSVTPTKGGSDWLVTVRFRVKFAMNGPNGVGPPENVAVVVNRPSALPVFAALRSDVIFRPVRGRLVGGTGIPTGDWKVPRTFAEARRSRARPFTEPLPARTLSVTVPVFRGGFCGGGFVFSQTQIDPTIGANAGADASIRTSSTVIGPLSGPGSELVLTVIRPRNPPTTFRSTGCPPLRPEMVTLLFVLSVIFTHDSIDKRPQPLITTAKEPPATAAATVLNT